MRHEYKTKIIIALIESNEFVKFFIAEGVAQQTDGIIAPGPPWMGLAPVACFGTDQFVIIGIHDDIHRTTSYAA